MGKQGPLNTSKLNCILDCGNKHKERAPKFTANTDQRIVKNEKIPAHRRRRRKRHLKTDFAFLETSGRLFQFANSAKCRRTLSNTNTS